MARRLKKKEKEMVAAWPETNEEAAWPETDEIPATEARPMALDFEAPNETSRQETRETQETRDTQEKAKRGEEKERRRTARDEKLRDMRHETKEKPKQNNELSTPSYLQTTTAGNQLSMDTIIDAVLGQYTCPEQLLNHTKHIKSFADVLANYKKRYSESIYTISSLSCSESLRNELCKYFSDFRSRNARLNEPATVAMLEKMANISNSTRLIVQKAWMRGAGLTQEESRVMAEKIRENGDMGDRSAQYSDLLKISYDGLAMITTEAMCYDGSGTDAADATVFKLHNMDVSGCSSASELLAHELKHWQDCLRELDEPPMANYLRLQNLKEACNRDARLFEICESLDDHTSRMKELKLSKTKSWSKMESLIADAWQMALKQGKLKAKDNIMSQEDKDSVSAMESANNGDLEKLSSHATTFVDVENSIVQKRADEFMKTASDATIKCTICATDFTDSIADQVNRVKKGWENKPKRCKPCNEKYKKERSEGATRQCIDFVKGKCTWGDKCKFSHGLPVHFAGEFGGSDESSDEEQSGEYSDEGDDDGDSDEYDNGDSEEYDSDHF